MRKRIQLLLPAFTFFVSTLIVVCCAPLNCFIIIFLFLFLSHWRRFKHFLLWNSRFFRAYAFHFFQWINLCTRGEQQRGSSVFISFRFCFYSILCSYDIVIGWLSGIDTGDWGPCVCARKWRKKRNWNEPKSSFISLRFAFASIFPFWYFILHFISDHKKWNK